MSGRTIRRRLGKSFRRYSSPLRMLPDTVVIGAQKAGTTSLFRYIADHPRVLTPTRKEVRYFHANYDRGLGWYRAHFPLRRAGRLTLEASTGYFDNPHAPDRIASTLPDVRLIAVLRDPVERAWSHYRHSVRLGAETLGFEAALEAEESRLRPQLERMKEDRFLYPRELATFSYKRRGRYAEHLERWFELFGREAVLIIPSDDLFRNPRSTMERVWEFLDLPPFYSADYRRFNPGDPGEPLPGATGEELRRYFAPYDERLERLLGMRLPWRERAVAAV